MFITVSGICSYSRGRPCREDHIFVAKLELTDDTAPKREISN